MTRRGGRSHPRPGLPVVNLLSQSEFDRMTVRRLRKRFVAGGVAMLLLVGAGWFVQHTRVNDAQKLVMVERAETSRLSSQAQTLTVIKAFVSGVSAQEQTVATTMAREIYFSEVLSGIRAASPSGTTLQSISVTLAPDAVGAGTPAGTAAPATGAPATAGAAVCPGPDPFQTETIVGCVTLSGTAVSRAEVGELVTRLADIGLFVEPFVSTTTTADSASVTFSGSVGLSEEVYSRRYAPAEPAAPADPADPDSPAPPASGDTTSIPGGAS
jgi:hypothetical protein